MDGADSRTKTAPKLTSLQALRALAATLVVFFHLRDDGTALYPSFRAGYSGVDIFFVLSGFIIFFAHRKDLGHAEQAGSFCRKRALRILPMYWIAVAFKCLIVRGKYRAVDTLVSLSLLPILSAQRVLSVSWSLTCELFFYGVFLLAIVSKRSFLPRLLGTWAVAILLATPFDLGPQTGPLVVVFSVRNLGFIMGVAVAWAADRRAPSHRTALVSLAVGAALFFATFALVDLATPNDAFGKLCAFGFAAGTALAIRGLVGLEKAERIGVPALLVFVGDASYSIYLSHIVVGSTIKSLLTHLRVSLLAFGLPILIPLLAIGVGCLVYVAVERPLLRRLRPRTVSAEKA